MNKEALYFHFANLALVIIGLFSIRETAGPAITALLVLGTVGGFLFSWYFRKSRPPHIDTFIGMLSLASVVIVLSRLTETEISFDNLLKIFSAALAWLTLFQSFGLSTQKSYSLVQFIAAALLISSVSLALEQENVYVIYLVCFLFVLIFAMRLSLVCEKQSKGSVIIGDSEEVMSLWHQVKIGAIMFSIVLILAGLVYPAVPRFNSLSLEWIPSTLLGLPEKVPLLKLMNSADKTIKDAKVKKEQIVDDGSKKRETDNRIKKEATKRFKATDFKDNIDAFKIETLTIKSDKSEFSLDQHAMLSAELKMADGTIVPAVKLVDWKVTGTAKVSLDKDGRLTAKEYGSAQVSATYLGTFSNVLYIKITEPVKPKKKKGFLAHLAVFLLWSIAAAICVFAGFIFIRSQKLSRMRRNDPKEFIKEIYYGLCNALKIYGVRKLNYISYREFYDLAKGLVSAKPEPMRVLTEGFMEARFSGHEISPEHSQKAMGLFREVKEVVLEKERPNKLWKDFLFRLRVLDISLIRE